MDQVHPQAQNPDVFVFRKGPNRKGIAFGLGFGIGLLVVLIRVWGGLPEGVMYAILLMNAVVPAINRLTQPRVFGTVREKKAKAVTA